MEVAVTVAVPTLTDVTRPEELIVATEVGLMVHATDGLLAGLPSLLVPTAVICTVLSVLPVSMVGDAGPTASDVRVGLTKKPLQLTARASVASTAIDPPTRSLFLTDDIMTI